MKMQDVMTRMYSYFMKTGEECNGYQFTDELSRGHYLTPSNAAVPAMAPQNTAITIK